MHPAVLYDISVEVSRRLKVLVDANELAPAASTRAYEDMFEFDDIRMASTEAV